MVAAELASKGYTDAGANGDFVVRIASGTDTEYAETDVAAAHENETTTGALVVDAFDRSTGQQVWHGTATAEIDPQKINEPALRTAVHQLLAPFPARTVQ
jgi:hypothetical protein